MTCCIGLGFVVHPIAAATAVNLTISNQPFFGLKYRLAAKAFC
jgi:hypothetical protein